MTFKITSFVVWISLLLVGVASMLHYDLTPAEVKPPPKLWPAESALSLNAEHPTILTFVHPHCPCSKASLDELGDFARQFPNRMHLVVLLVKPPGFELDWEKTDLWDLATAIPDAIVCTDDDGREAARFRATASGECLYYDTSGRLQFHGGLTPLRGHRGENAGIAALESLLAGVSANRSQSPVFGCALCDRAAELQCIPTNKD